MVSQKSHYVAIVYILILLWSCDSHKVLCPSFRSYKLGVCLVCQKRNKEST